ncbi:signal peptidase I [Motilibacter rhizosphaerae]|uniref:Signal peptidase I n=1 Tax=Motilibacter rhizosphaerae TaxID=598652 RepID=A0A4Q7NRT8_9ACTN|nr:signal peptidase I [Motilibacter rhizosphaerae]RZS89781.1 signal peptidase I [Motilibacter rhizosphaerae]
MTEVHEESGTQQVKRSSRWRSWLELPVIVGVALLLSLLVRSFLVEAFVIPSGSMEQTLRVGDRIAVEKVGYRFGSISRGDVVVFHGPAGWESETSGEGAGGVLGAVQTVGSWFGLPTPSDDDFVKRVIGLPGDHVECAGPGLPVKVNGKAVAESYIYPGDDPSGTPFSVTVPPGDLWVMGDHRGDSADSRSHLDDPDRGFVPEHDVVGRAVAVVWPPTHWRRLPRD